MILNQQLTEKQYNDFMEWFSFNIQYPTNYIEIKEQWLKGENIELKYEDLKDYDLYKEIYKNYPKKEYLLKYIKTKFKKYWLNVEKAVDQLSDILSI